MNSVKFESAGVGVDNELWCALMDTKYVRLRHQLWTQTCMMIADHFIKFNNDCKFDSPDALLKDWMHESIPHSDDLLYILDGANYFHELIDECEWDTIFSFSGNPLELIGGIRDAILDTTSNPEAEEAITDEMIESFYVFWRSGFLRKVAEAAKT